jgi:hypothetical protein
MLMLLSKWPVLLSSDVAFKVISVAFIYVCCFQSDLCCFHVDVAFKVACVAFI